MSDFEKLINASDLIEWIMEAYPDWCVGDVRSIVDHINKLPSAEPEIIRCKDCINWMAIEDRHYCGMLDGWDTDPNWYCADAERREE